MSSTQSPAPINPKDVVVHTGGPGDGSSFGALPGGGNIMEIHDTNPLDPPLPYDLKPKADKATQDEHLQLFVNRATVMRDGNRKKVCLEVFGDNYNRMRELAGSIKQHTLDHLDYYLEQFIDNATAAGTTVHFAKDGAEVNSICVELAKKYGTKLLVKSKSMVTEETHLVPDLQKIGVEAVETDLGEYILQIDNDHPSHIVTPMIHKDRVATAKAFQRVLGVEYTDEPAKLAQIARNVLRDKYRKSDMGMSGGNFLVAETGSVVIVTNEGNGRFSTSAPKVHVAVVGMEKLIPRREHLAVMLKMLARSSTGQPLTVYTHIMTGPKRATEPDGPEHMHIILVDNGRSEVLREETREMLRCIRCGACLNACPVYRKIGGHAYGAVYSGPIGAILTPMLKGLSNYPDLPNASSLCGACYEACPVKINIPKFLIQLRKDMVSRAMPHPIERFIYRSWAKSLNFNLGYVLSGIGQRLVFRLQARLNGSLKKGDPYSARGYIDKSIGPVGAWTSQRDMPSPTAKSFRDWWKENRK